MTGYKQIHKSPKANTNGFDKNPQNISPWRPRKWVSYLSAEIKKKIWKTPTKSQIEDIVVGMLELTTEELMELQKDKDTSIMIKTIAERLVANDKSFDALNSLLDRGIGKAVQRQDITTGGDKINALSDDDAKMLEGIHNAGENTENAKK